MWEKIRDKHYCRERLGRVQILRVASASLTTHFTQFQGTISESDMIQECSRLALLGPHPSRSQACSSEHR
jgi:hypothetical protein